MKGAFMINSYYFSDGDIQLSPHFMLHEFQSRNGCDEVLIDDALIDLLEKVFRVSGASSATVMMVTGNLELIAVR